MFLEISQKKPQQKFSTSQGCRTHPHLRTKTHTRYTTMLAKHLPWLGRLSSQADQRDRRSVYSISIFSIHPPISLEISRSATSRRRLSSASTSISLTYLTGLRRENSSLPCRRISPRGTLSISWKWTKLVRKFNPPKGVCSGWPVAAISQGKYTPRRGRYGWKGETKFIVWVEIYVWGNVVWCLSLLVTWKPFDRYLLGLWRW